MPSGSGRGQTNSLALVAPNIAKEFDHEKNKPLTIDTVRALDKRRVYWVCHKCGYQFERGIYQRVKRGGACPNCTPGYKNTRSNPVPGRSLAELYPQVAKQFHPTLNGSLKPEMITANSSRRCTWQCDVESSHVWAATVTNRTTNGSGCPYCNHKQFDASSSLLGLRPDLAKYWHYERNGKLRPENIGCRSKQQIWWHCINEPEHAYKTAVETRVDASGECKTCRGWHVTNENRLSLLHSDLAKEFHPTKNRLLYPAERSNSKWYPRNYFAPGEEPKKNRRLRPADLPANCSERVWWKCARGHEWQAVVYKRTHDGQGCPFCSRRKIASDTSLAAAFPAVARLLHPTKNGQLTASQIAPQSGKKLWFRCFRVADHDFCSKLQSVIRSWESGTNACPYCHGKKVKHRDSLAVRYPAVAKMLHPTRNTIDAKQVLPMSGKRAVFQCPRVRYHSWETEIITIVESVQKNNTGCPYCSGRKTHPRDSLKRKYPEVARQIDQKRSDVSTDALHPGSHRVLIFRCKKNPFHVWEQELRLVVRNFTKGTELCPHCRKS